MKNFILLSVFIFFVASTYGQRKIEEDFKISPNQTISVDFKFSHDIKVVQWSKQEIKVNASVMVDDGKGNSDYSLKTQDSPEVFSIASDFGDYFKRKNENGVNNCSSKTEINYIVYVPENAHLKVKSISGDVYAETFSGELETDLVAGDVELKHYNGNLSLKTVSGNLDITMDKAIIDAKTLTGTIYSDLDIQRDQYRKSSSVSTRIVGTVSSGGKKVKLETVSGNIYMRKG